MQYTHPNQMNTLKIYFILLACVFLYPNPSRGQENKSPQTPVSTQFIDQVLQVAFELHVPALGLGAARLFCLLLEPKKQRTQEDMKYVDYYGSVKAQVIHRLSELRGKVHITSPAAALSFVRLPTSPMTFSALDRHQEPGY